MYGKPRVRRDWPRKLLPLFLALGILLTSPSGPCSASEGVPVAPREPAKVLLLGTFHFEDSGLDSYRPQHGVDVRSGARQREVEEVLRCLEHFAPTKVAVEVRPSQGKLLEERYRAYEAGELELPANEVYQLGFRLARRLGHEGVHPVDAEGRIFEPYVDPEEYAARYGLAETLEVGQALWEEYYDELYAHDDAAKLERSLREHLLYLNQEERILLGHGRYLVGAFGVKRGDEYPGPDARTKWYNRNLRIFANLQGITEGPKDRILVVIGAGHVPILRHAVRASPEYELVEVESVLGSSCGVRSPAAESD